MIRDRIRRGPELAKAGLSTARLSFRGERFEIIVRPEKAWQFKRGRSMDISEILAIDIIFTDVGKGLRASAETLMRCFQTTDVHRIAETILRKGELQITIEQRRRMIEDKKKQIVDFICRNCVDSRTGLPVPSLRVDQAIERARISIDPFRDVEEQAKEIVEKLRPIIPLRLETVKLLLRIPPTFAPRAYGTVRKFGRVSREEWLTDGSWKVEVEIPAGLRSSFLDRIMKITQSTAQVKVLD